MDTDLLETTTASQLSLRTALQLHDEFTNAQALPGCLGDGLLLKWSSIDARVRAKAIAQGFEFSATPPFDYASAPMRALDDIYSHRHIPYIENVAPLRELERKHPDLLSLEEADTLGIYQNHVLHESVHCLVRDALRSTTGVDSRTPTERSVLDSLFEEACANAVEALAFAAVLRAPPLCRVFMTMNNYQENSWVEPVLDEHGEAETLRILIVAFLCANFLYKEVSDSVIGRLLQPLVERLPQQEEAQRNLAALFRGALSLSAHFRLQTTPIYLKLSGHTGSVFELLDFEFSEELAGGRRVRRVLDELVEVVVPRDAAQ